ncbi:hypothetical protein HNV08_09995 [Winogradskyella eckloniae]|uniref:hypothetical protein n=1 Tax=Winogradskyella eckloniae TaxID=1089306 RepID=UPI001564E47C|nr:hypothetical protein [Winogradskyella eckloniae]NRD20378.1 hypothetical protein [Winogradskyella eckloniae]
MRNVLQLDGVSFWVDQDVIHCKPNSDFFSKYTSRKMIACFSDVIPLLSEGSYLPLLIDVVELERPCALRLFNIISTNSRIKQMVLSRIFVVNSYRFKFILMLNNLLVKQVVPNKIFKNYKAAMKFCKEDYLSFNAVSRHKFS